MIRKPINYPVRTHLLTKQDRNLGSFSDKTSDFL